MAKKTAKEKIEKYEKKIGKLEKKLQKYEEKIKKLSQIDAPVSAETPETNSTVPEKVSAIPAKELPAASPQKEESAAPVPVKARRTKRTSTDGKKKAPAARKRNRVDRPKATYAFFNCNADKSPESKFNENDEVFQGNLAGRQALWKKIKGEQVAGKIEFVNKTEKEIREIVLNGKAETISENLKFGLVEIVG